MMGVLYMALNYHEELIKKNTLLLREKLKGLPRFVAEFYRGIENSTSARTRLSYAHDFGVFFNFLVKETQTFADKQITDLETADLDRVTAADLDDYMEYLTYYIKNIESKKNGAKEVEVQNAELGKARKLFAIRSMYAYFYKRQKIKNNPTDFIITPKTREKAKVYLDFHEVARLLDEVETGESLNGRQKEFHKYTKTRDLAILTLMLGTGIRISECVGLDINHVDCGDGSFMVTRKGGDSVILYFGDEVGQALEAYLDERAQIVALAGHEDALFLSIQRRRLKDRAIQNLVKKYSKLITTLKNITPHKLRTTFGTNLYKETGDIYLVADVLGHADVNTTKKHYADTLGSQGRKTARNIKLRE
jgi:site-specific recombinase XerD